MINENYAKTFLDNQGKLFDEPVANTIEEAMEFLEDVMVYLEKIPLQVISKQFMII